VTRVEIDFGMVPYMTRHNLGHINPNPPKPKPFGHKKLSK